VVVLAVKPQIAVQVLRNLHATLQGRPPVLLSIVAGLRIADLTRLCPDAMPIVRAMPNRAALVGAGITGCLRRRGCDRCATQHR
jgi:pyrroline-5-carboxylate reductase